MNESVFGRDHQGVQFFGGRDLPSKVAHSTALSYPCVNRRIWKFGRTSSFSRSGTMIVHGMSKIQLYSARTSKRERLLLKVDH